MNTPPRPEHSRENRAIADAFEIHRLDEDGKVNEAGDSFVRYWPPCPLPGTAPDGNTLSFLRYLSRDPAVPLLCECPGGYSLTLDRQVSAPNAEIGVTFIPPSPYRSQWIFMRPGDTCHVPGGFERFWIYNADLLDKTFTAFQSFNFWPVGYAGFLVGTRRNGSPPVQRDVHPFSRLIGVYVFDPANPGTEYALFGRGACRNVEIVANGMDDTGALASGPFVFPIHLHALHRRLPLAAGNTGYSRDGETLDHLVAGTLGTCEQGSDFKWLNVHNGETRSAWRFHLGEAPAYTIYTDADLPIATWCDPETPAANVMLNVYGYGENP